MSEGLRVTEPRVLMVDDEKKVADAYALRLKDVAAVTVAYGGNEALETLDPAKPPDVVLLDRHMPGLSGDEVLAQLRDRDLRTRIIMVTAVDPDLGVLDMPFDDYLSKPVERADLHAAVDQQCQVLAYELLGEYFQRAATRNVAATELAGGGSESRLDDIETELSGLERRIRGLLPQAAELLDGFTEIDRRGY